MKDAKPLENAPWVTLCFHWRRENSSALAHILDELTLPLYVEETRRLLGGTILKLVPHEDRAWHIEGETLFGSLPVGGYAPIWCRERDLNSHTVASTGF